MRGVTIMRLLVVEDQKDLNEIIVRKLTNEHYSVDAGTTPWIL